MSIDFRCSGCQKPIRVPDDAAGKKAKCPGCGTIFTIPAATTVAPPTPRPQAPQPAAAAPRVAAPVSQPVVSPAVAPNPFAPISARQSFAAPRGASPIGRNLVSVGAVMRHAWQAYRGNLGMCIGLTMFCLLLVFVGQAIIYVAALVLPPTRIGALPFVSMFFGAWFSLVCVQLWLAAGHASYFVKAAQGKACRFSDVFGGLRLVPNMLGVWFFCGLMNYGAGLVCVSPAIASVFMTRNESIPIVLFLIGYPISLVISLIIALVFGQSYFLVVDRHAGPIQALGLSKRLTNGNKATIFGLLLLAGLINLFGFLAIGIGLLFTVPFTLMLFAAAYVGMSGPAPQPA